MNYQTIVEREREVVVDNKNSSSLLINVITRISEIFGERDTPLFQVLIFSKIKNFLRHVVLINIYKNDTLFEGKSTEVYDEMIFDDFVNLALNLGVLKKANSSLEVSKEYVVSDLEKAHFLKGDVQNLKKSLQVVFNDYKYINDLIRKQSVEKLSKSTDIVYIFIFVQYILELENMSFSKKILPRCSEDFYTDLGKLAFELYTKEKYKNLVLNNSVNKVLDIGCGHGSYIDLILSINKDVNVIGIERQDFIFHKIQKKYHSLSNVTILKEDITKTMFDEKFDWVTMGYMLFYLSYEEKLALFKNLWSILDSEGKIVVCQYYPEFEKKQKLISIHNKDWNFVNRYKFDIGNSLIYAEVLLNRVIKDFKSVEYWSEFLEILNLSNLKVSEIVPADSMYYSYFILITKK